MKQSYQGSWNAARVASMRPLPRERRTFAPVGGLPLAGNLDVHCKSCGYRVCSCAPKPKHDIAGLMQHAREAMERQQLDRVKTELESRMQAMAKFAAAENAEADPRHYARQKLGQQYMEMYAPKSPPMPEPMVNASASADFIWSDRLRAYIPVKREP